MGRTTCTLCIIGWNIEYQHWSKQRLPWDVLHVFCILYGGTSSTSTGPNSTYHGTYYMYYRVEHWVPAQVKTTLTIQWDVLHVFCVLYGGTSSTSTGPNSAYHGTYYMYFVYYRVVQGVPALGQLAPIMGRTTCILYIIGWNIEYQHWAKQRLPWDVLHVFCVL